MAGERNVRYQVLQQEEDLVTQTPEVPPEGIPPPEYELTEGARAGTSAEAEAAAAAPPEFNLADGSTGPKCQGTFPAPPPYNVAAAELPSYEEAQRAKMLEEEDRRQQHQEMATLFSRDEDILGTDFLFFTSFFVAFLFNWVGFLLLLCFCHTLAGRYGALAGFGLSLAKWTLIVKHSTDFVNRENEWLWWIIMAFGILICARACLQYIHAKREWRMLNPLHRERLFFFY